jgi:hypothetical protein
MVKTNRPTFDLKLKGREKEKEHSSDYTELGFLVISKVHDFTNFGGGKGGRKMGLKFAAMNGSGGCYIREQRIRKGYINFMFWSLCTSPGRSSVHAEVGSLGKRGGTLLAVKSLSKCVCDGSWGLGVGE